MRVELCRRRVLRKATCIESLRSRSPNQLSALYGGPQQAGTAFLLLHQHHLLSPCIADSMQAYLADATCMHWLIKRCIATHLLSHGKACGSHNDCKTLTAHISSSLSIRVKMKEMQKNDADKPDTNEVDEESPPSYEEAVESPYALLVQPVEDSETLELLINATSSSMPQSGTFSRWKSIARTPTPTKPLQLVPLDPKAIKCRCGKHNDTTQSSPGFPQGCVRCTCKYLVFSDGSSHHEASPITCPRPRCGRQIPRISGICSLRKLTGKPSMRRRSDASVKLLLTLPSAPQSNTAMNYPKGAPDVLVGEQYDGMAAASWNIRTAVVGSDGISVRRARARNELCFAYTQFSTTTITTTKLRVFNFPWSGSNANHMLRSIDTLFTFYNWLSITCLSANGTSSSMQLGLAAWRQNSDKATSNFAVHTWKPGRPLNSMCPYDIEAQRVLVAALKLDANVETNIPISKPAGTQESMQCSPALPDKATAILDGVKIQEAATGTFTWLVRPTSGFGDWISNFPRKDILWVMGKAGSGKSTFMKFMVNNLDIHGLLQSSAGDRKVLVLRHFFWYDGIHEQTSFSGLMRNLLHQLCLADSNLIEASFKPRWDKTRLVWAKPWNETELWESLVRSLQSADFEVCVFIDALDECKPSSRHPFVRDKLREFSKMTNVRICVSARSSERLSFPPAVDDMHIQLDDRTYPDLRCFAAARLANTGLTSSEIEQLMGYFSGAISSSNHFASVQAWILISNDFVGALLQEDGLRSHTQHTIAFLIEHGASMDCKLELTLGNEENKMVIVPTDVAAAITACVPEELEDELEATFWPLA
ncbi:uncharacterized protein MYCFIDRAFT_171067 [Pseudocercospora fijiensis CIRAD86]|uniref:Nephrocystin 3-like N-terminal domain-containing protein n=1 Tax=Pseudocercospora fijiensis (strain CIRAD86) TaxID=383855 RepID=N1Q9W6_PSEFD|nr:uncharacterized protein MYCFIDRAFT_171067 [Pseudocercospora fijiensis CIRAD86]EME89649.1 hypothetical protein MYCFIDRAFT_171067 [Pseudocercospora fijiensis CIRAD86]